MLTNTVEDLLDQGRAARGASRMHRKEDRLLEFLHGAGFPGYAERGFSPEKG